MMIAEKEIIRLCKASHPKGQEALVHQYSKVLMGLAFRYSLSLDTSKDIVQDSFIQIFKNFKSFDANKGALSSWMKSICINIILMHIRKEKRLFENQKEYVLSVKRDQNYQTVHASMFQDDLYKILLKLPDNQRLVFSLFAIEGFSHSEISEKLEIAESHSRTILARARKQLQKLLQEHNIQKYNSYARS